MNFIRKIVLGLNLFLKGLAEECPDITKQELDQLDSITNKILNQLKESD